MLVADHVVAVKQNTLLVPLLLRLLLLLQLHHGTCAMWLHLCASLT
jgi:hypothetical protein